MSKPNDFFGIQLLYIPVLPKYSRLNLTEKEKTLPTISLFTPCGVSVWQFWSSDGGRLERWYLLWVESVILFYFQYFIIKNNLSHYSSSNMMVEESQFSSGWGWTVAAAALRCLSFSLCALQTLNLSVSLSILLGFCI